MFDKWKEPHFLKNLFWRNFFLFFILIVVVSISWWLGSLVGKYSLQDLLTKPLPPTTPEGERLNGQQEDKEGKSPFYLYVGGEPCDEIAQKEFQYAKDTGITNFIVEVPFPWRGSDDLPELFHILQCMNDIVPHGKYWIFVDLNPPEDWFQGKKSVNIVVNGEVQPFASFHTLAWKKSVEEGLSMLVNGLQSSKVGEQVGGFILGFLKNRWWLAPGLDESEYALTNFNKWVHNRYPSPEERVQLFGVDNLEPPFILENLKKEVNTPSNFLNYTENNFLVNYRKFHNESLADSIGFCATTLRQLLNNEKKKIFFPYGLNIETAEVGTGQLSLGTLLESDVDGFVLPISYVNRGLGEAGGPSGTMESINLHGKEVLLLDDTRTGVSFDITTQQTIRVKGVRSENIYAVQKRNLGTALVHNASLIWTDPEGKGWLLDIEQWDLFKKMMQVYTQISAQTASSSALRLQPRTSQKLPHGNMTPENSSLPRLQVGKYNTEEIQTELPAVTSPENILWEPLAMIIDERAMHLLSPKGIELFSRDIINVRDQLLKVGLPVEFYLMQDLLDEQIPKKLIYFIFNLYPPNESEVQILHHIFEIDKSIVFWYYAPGWGKTSDDTSTVQLLTQINSRLSSPDAVSGSTMDLDGRWLSKNEPFGENEAHFPLLYIEDENADVITRYQSNGKPSVALKTINDKWVSVFYAEPTVNYLVMREILSILEVPTAVAEGSMETPDNLLVGSNILVIHTKGIGDRILQFNQFLNIENMFQPEQKWFERETLLLSLGNGETVFLHFLPQ